MRTPTRFQPARRAFGNGFVLVLLACFALLSAACGGGEDVEDGGGDGHLDGGKRDGSTGEGGVGEGGIRDAATDARTPDAGSCVPACMGFNRCVGGTCVPYPMCTGSMMCPDGQICVSWFCVPEDADLDGDGSPLSEDCDDSNPLKCPECPERCNNDDDDCDDMVDEAANPEELCEDVPGGGSCEAGSCGCPPDQYDLSDTEPGCDCTAEPVTGTGNSCLTAINLGEIPDNGGAPLVRTGNVIPDDREVWYSFVARDTVDAGCDTMHVRVQFTDNPGNLFQFTVMKDACAPTGACGDTAFNDYSWATDFRSTATPEGTIGGECPCNANPGVPVDGQTNCSDNTANFYVRVRRNPAITLPLTCQKYSLEISNGVYHTL